MTWNSGRSADWRHSDMEGTTGKLTTVRKRETPEELAERLGYLPHGEALNSWRRRGLDTLESQHRDDAQAADYGFQSGRVMSNHMVNPSSRIESARHEDELPPCMRSE